ISILGNGVGILYSLLHLLLLLSMFGGHVTVPVNSPHLRKSGSRQLFSDLETTEMKLAAGAQLATAAMLPSPVLLWRLKVMLFFLWGFSCCKTAAVWFWGANLWVFAQSNVNYSKIFDLDQNHLSHKEIWKAIAFADFFVADILTSMSKVFSDLERSVCRMVHRQVATIAWFEADSVCGSHAIAIPIVLVLPYIFRLFQCLRQYKDTREKTSLLNGNLLFCCVLRSSRSSVISALKYSTAVPVIFLSALKYHVFPDNWINFYRPLWLLSSFLNSLYSFYWDVTRDWDLSCFTRIFKFTKPHIVSQLIYGQKWVYLWVIGSNLILRCTWTYKLSAHLRHNHLTVFAITTLEIFRRFQWAFFRVENEWNKMSSKQNIQMGEISGEEVKLLNSNNHNV
ncbi:ERD1/XPR1/SYG1 protein, partial [Tanacetum coccineum]